MYFEVHGTIISLEAIAAITPSAKKQKAQILFWGSHALEVDDFTYERVKKALKEYNEFFTLEEDF